VPEEETFALSESKNWLPNSIKTTRSTYAKTHQNHVEAGMKLACVVHNRSLLNLVPIFKFDISTKGGKILGWLLGVGCDRRGEEGESLKLRTTPRAGKKPGAQKKTGSDI